MKETSKLENTTDEEAREEFVKFLELEDAAKYRKKIKGLHLPFNTHDKISSQERESGDKD